ATALDGLPLALELAAPAIAAVGVDAVLRSIRDLGNVQQPAVGGDPRDRTVESTIRWSWQRLDPGAQRLGGALSVLRGEFDAEMIVAIADTIGRCDVADVVALVELSLLQRVRNAGPSPRYCWLHTVRRHVERELTTAVDLDAVRSAVLGVLAHRADVVAAATPFMSATEWRSAIDPDLVNHRSAFAWASTLGCWPEGIRVLGAFMLRPYELAGLAYIDRWAAQCDIDALDPLCRVKLLNGLACVSVLRGDYSATEQPTAAAVEAARAAGDPVQLVDALSLRFAAAVLEGKAGEAAAQFAETEAACRASGHLWGLAFIHTFMGTAHRRSGNLAESAARLEEATRISHHVGEGRLQALSLSSQGRTQWHLGEHERAAELCREAWAIARRIDDAASIALAGIAHGWISHRAGESELAMEVLEGALEAALAMGNRTTVSSGLEWMGLIRSDQGQPTVLATVDGFTEIYRVTASERPQHAVALEAARLELGDSVFEIARQRGRNSTIDEIIALLVGSGD
ncbi:MAG: hypothetical protein P8N02_01740, partial [Actinomycetota bacterium]|nr:hypothetical protein [Actinomycetota bacterium]